MVLTACLINFRSDTATLAGQLLLISIIAPYNAVFPIPWLTHSKATGLTAESSSDEYSARLSNPSAYIKKLGGVQTGANHGSITFSRHTETTLFAFLVAHNEPQD